MATETITKLVDDLDGTAADRTFGFTLDGTRYEIDLTQKNIERLRKTMQPFTEKARRVGRAPRPRMPRRTTTIAERKATNDEIRAWAKEQGLKVADKGRIPNAVIEQYKAS